MSLLNNVTHLKFFKNKEFNQLYLAMFGMTLGESLINVFVPIYLFKLGFPIYQILFFYFLVSLFFVLFSYGGVWVVSKAGEKHAILISTPFLVVYYLGLVFLEELPWLFFLLPLLLALRMILFNYGYHLNFINHSERSRRGRELAFLGIITSLATILAPYLGSLLAGFSFNLAFMVSSGVILAGTVPLFFSSDKQDKIDFTSLELFRGVFSKKNRGNFISFSGYAIESIIGRMIWPIFIILILETIERTGLVISGSMLLSLGVFYFVGKLTDKVSRATLLKIGTVLYFFAWVGRIFANTAYKIFFIDSYKNLSEKVLHLPWAAHSYDIAKRTNYFSFIVSREIIFNLIRVGVLPILMLIFWWDFYPFIISFSLAGLFSVGYAFIDS
jgi:MFS family permease